MDRQSLEHLFNRKYAKSATHEMRTCFWDYQETALEMARQLLLANFSLDFVYKNLVAVRQEHTLTVTGNSTQQWYALYSDVVFSLRQYCEFVKTTGGEVPDRVKEVRYPID